MKQNITFVPKHLNPANIPQARPIENFWGDLAQKVYDGGWEAQNEDQLIRRIKKCLQESMPKTVPVHMKHVKQKIKNITNNRVFSLFKKLDINKQ